MGCMAFAREALFAQVAQRLGRDTYESEGWGFESLRAHGKAGN
jgi:hypothetical protein